MSTLVDARHAAHCAQAERETARIGTRIAAPTVAQEILGTA